jgi:putative OPT family oligopeptide transporter
MATTPRRGPCPEITLPAIIVGIVVGILFAACFTYTGMLMGFTISASAIAAIVGFGVLRGLLRGGTILENNINQTIASTINIATPGLIFTVPAFYLMGLHESESFNPVLIGLAATAGALLGILFIIPLRKQMIELDRLRFPSATAVATVLKSPGAGVVKAQLLLVGVVFGAAVTALQQFPERFEYWIRFSLPEEVNLGQVLRMPPYVENVWALSVFSLAAGFISGRPGLVVLAGGVLSYWLVTPVAVNNGWIDATLMEQLTGPAENLETVGAAVSRWVHANISRPIGIGMLVGGALTGILVAFPSILAALGSLRRVRLRGGGAEELPIKYLYVGVGLAFLLLFFATYSSLTPTNLPRSLFVAAIGTLWLALAGVIVAQATGMTDWSPISGLALIAIVVSLVLTDHSIAAAILIGATVCVAIGEAADMMQDLKTGHLVGSKPIRQQAMELAFVMIGPAVCLATIAMLWISPGFGPDHQLSAPQAQAVQATVQAVAEGTVPWPKYIGGATIGGLLGLSGISGVGVLVGLSMYLPLSNILPYGLGCVIQMVSARIKGERWVEDYGVPLAAGFVVGEPLVVLVKSLYVCSGPMLEAIRRM